MIFQPNWVEIENPHCQGFQLKTEKHCWVVELMLGKIVLLRNWLFYSKVDSIFYSIKLCYVKFPLTFDISQFVLEDNRSAPNIAFQLKFLLLFDLNITLYIPKPLLAIVRYY